MLQNFWLDVTILIKSRKILSPVLIILRHNTNENNTRVVATPPSGDYVDHPDKSLKISATNRLIGEVVQSRRRPLLGPYPG